MSLPGDPRGSDGPTGDACESTSGTGGFRTASTYGATLGTCMLGEIHGPRTSSTEEDLRGRDRSRLLDGTPAGAPGGALGGCAPTLTGNSRGTDGPSGGRALARGSALVEPRFPSTIFFLEQRPDPSSFRLKHFHHAAPTELSCPSASARKADYFGHRPPDSVPRTSLDSASFPDALVNLMPATERPGPSQYASSKKGKMEGKMVRQRESTNQLRQLRAFLQ